MGLFKKNFKPIEKIDEYINLTYGEKIENKKGKILTINPVTLEEFSGRNICSLVALSRLAISENNILSTYQMKNIFEILKAKANNWAYRPRFGTVPFFIPFIYKKSSRIIERYFKEENLRFKKLKLKNRLFISFKKVKEIIDENSTFILNIYGGYYSRHTVTVIGYCQVVTDRKTRHFLALADGWSEEIRYIDFDKSFWPFYIFTLVKR